jgi:hypothetical protein
VVAIDGEEEREESRQGKIESEVGEVKRSWSEVRLAMEIVAVVCASRRGVVVVVERVCGRH